MPTPQKIVAAPTFGAVQMEALVKDLVYAHDGLPSLEVLAAMSRLLDEQLREHATAAAVRGHSWSEIGAVCGISKQAAWERYSRPRSA